MDTGQEEFRRKLEAMPEPQQKQMMKFVQVMSQPPETFLAMFDRVGIAWERRRIDGFDSLVIKWHDFSIGEKTLQDQGPILKRLLTEEFGEMATNRVAVNENGQIVEKPVLKPEEFTIIEKPTDDEGVFG